MKQVTDWLEIVRERHDCGRARAVMFDFDGTLSLIRQGWQQVMIPLMVEILLDTPAAEDETTVQAVVTEFVSALTGKETIYQMMRLAAEVAKRGGQPLAPLEYKREYLRRLDCLIRGRKEALASGCRKASEFLVPGAVDLLALLRSRGLSLYCASGTDEPYARQEAELLGIAGCFEGGVRGAHDDYRAFSKQQLIAAIVSERGLRGAALAVIGDGFVEIEEGTRVGALTVGIASDEPWLLAGGREPRVDAWKRQRLIAAGADVIVPDFRNARRLADWLAG